MVNDNRLQFWEDRSSLGYSAGSGDIVLKSLEINNIKKYLGNSKNILDVGCGNGITLVDIAKNDKDIKAVGFDYSQGMVDAANEFIKESKLSSNVNVFQCDLNDISVEKFKGINLYEDGFDLIFTERCIINLDTLEIQKKAIQNLWKLLKPEGRLILCESFNDGLAEINNLRENISLEKIIKPWHNTYLNLSDLNFLKPERCTMQIKEFSGSYYFVSRVINAFQSQQENKLPVYDSVINKMSLKLEPLPVCGQTKIIIFDKV